MRPIALGFRCNNACIFCAQGQLSIQRPDRPEVSLADVEPNEVVAFVGGEPTLDDQLVTLVEQAHARGARRIVVQTNGRRLAYRAYARALREASDKLSLDVSLHGATVPMHDYHTMVEGSFQQTVLGVRNARAEGVEVNVTTVVTRSNYRHLVEIVQVARGVGAKAIQFVLAERLGRAARSSDRIIAPLALVEPYLTRAVREAARFGLGWVVGDRASSLALRESFAGLGEVELPVMTGEGRSEATTGLRKRLPVIAQFGTVDQGAV